MLALSHVEVCPLAWLMTTNNESHWVVQFFTTFFPASCIACALLLYMTCLLHNSQWTHTVLLYAGAVWKTFTTNCNLYKKQPEHLQPTNASWWSFSHISKLSTSKLAPVPFYVAHYPLIDLEIIPRFFLV